jgi:hypothetical protein
MGNNITFSPNSATPMGTIPKFVGHGSVLAHPDVIPVFWGPYWPGSGEVTAANIRTALGLMVEGPYLDGLRQYGYVGPVNIRPPFIDTSSPNVVFPPIGPNVNQQVILEDAVDTIIDKYVNDDVDNVDDNSNLILIVFVDPSIPLAIVEDGAGNQQIVGGVNSMVERSEFLDDNLRYTLIVVNTSGNNLAAVTQRLSHELVESISDPYDNGWEQIGLPPDTSQGQIGDVCNQPAISNGVGVVAYWSEADQACIVPTSGTRRISLSQTLSTHEPHNSLPKSAFVDFPLICGGPQWFGFVERTYRNEVTVNLSITGYEAPVITYTINGNPVDPWGGTLDVDAIWDQPRSNAIFPDFPKPATARLRTWSISPKSGLTVAVGPNEGNTLLDIAVIVQESFDNTDLGGGSTKITGVVSVALLNQEIVWSPEYLRAYDNCYKIFHMHQSVVKLIGAIGPDDPPSIISIVTSAVEDSSRDRADKLRSAAALLEGSRPEIAKALIALAQRSD